MDPRKRLPVLLLVQLGVCALLIVTVSQFVVKTDKIKHVQNPIPLNDTTFAAEKRQLDTSLEVKHFIEQTPKSSNGVIIQPDVPISDAKKIIDYKTELLIDYETEMMKLNKAKVAQDDPWLIKLIRDYYIEPPSSLPYNLTYPDRTDYSKGQAPFVDSRLNYLEGGFFVECGAFTGELRSNTLLFEKSRKWSGLLIEADPSNYAILKSKNRKAFTVNACLNTEPYPAMMTFNKHSNRGRLIHGTEVENWLNQSKLHGEEIMIQCFPLYSLLLALNQTAVDFLSLDVEGDELYILQTIPFTKVDIKMMTVEYVHGKGGAGDLRTYLRKKGYDSLIRISRWDYLANDVIFRKKEFTYWKK